MSFIALRERFLPHMQVTETHDIPSPGMISVIAKQTNRSSASASRVRSPLSFSA